MDKQSSSSKKIQWKWVAITFVLYLIFYLLPIAVALELLKENIAAVIVGVWLFGGIIIVAAVAAFFSKGITIIEPAIAGALMVTLLIVISLLYMIYTHPGTRFSITQGMPFTIGIICIVFVLSLAGAWIGERAQKLLGSKNSG